MQQESETASRSEIGRWATAYHRDPSDETLERLIESAATRLRLLASQLFHSGDRLRRFVTSDDLFQEFAIKLPRSIQMQRPESSRALVALSARIMRHTLVDFARQLFGNEIAWGNIQPNEDRNPIEAADRHESPSRSMQLDEARLCVLEAVEKLNEFEKEVFDLHYIKGLPQHEIAEMTGVSQGKVSKTWVRVKATLASRVEHAL
ncbi:MAG: sigma-70 family RNA polymerase sigma factor [Planctomycetota bacterium]